MTEAPRDLSRDRGLRSANAAKYRLEILSNKGRSRFDMGLALVTLGDPTYTIPGMWNFYMTTPNLAVPDKSEFNFKLKVIAHNLATTQLPNIPNLDRDDLGIADERYIVAIAKSVGRVHPDLANTFLREYSSTWATIRSVNEPETLAEEKYERLKMQLVEPDEQGTEPEAKRPVLGRLADRLRRTSKDPESPDA